jgi:polyketide synthase PksJ
MIHSPRSAVRAAQPTDLSRLCELEKLCWPEELRVSRRVVERRLSRPRGQFVIEVDGDVRGVLYSQRIQSIDELSTACFDKVDQLHRDDGPIAHVLSLNIDPASSSRGYGDALLEHVLAWYEQNGVTTAIGVTGAQFSRALPITR